MAQLLDNAWSGVEPYTGRTDDIDITSEPLFCPNCGCDTPLRVNREKTAVSCANPVMLDWCGEYCEYQYTLTEQRVANDGFWTEGFKYPKTRTQVLRETLDAYTTEVMDIPRQRKLANKEFDEHRDKLVGLIAEIKTELGVLCE